MFLFERNTAFVLQGSPSGRCVAHFVFEITLSQAITLTLLLVCAFSPRVHSFPRGPRIFARNDVFYPQRAKGTHRAEGNIAFANRQNIASSLFQGSLPGHLVNPTQDTFVLAWRKRNKQAKE